MNKKLMKMCFTEETRQDATDKKGVANKIKKQAKDKEEQYRKNCQNNTIENNND